MATRRTTIAASTQALDTLQAEADRREVPLSAILIEAIEEKAAALRTSRRPRFGTGSSDGRSPGAARLTAEPIADDPR